MKKIAALAVVLGAGMAANAQVLNYGGTGPLLAMQSNTQNFNLGGSGTITGFSISADMLATSGGSWQADMMLTITSPDSVVFNIGGFTNEVNPWNSLGGTGTFPGATGAAGSFSATYPVAFGNVAGNWTVELRNDWSSATAALEWNNVTITLIPAPGAAALLGMGGLLAIRRRR